MKHKSFIVSTLILISSLPNMTGQNPEIARSLRNHVEILASDSLGGRRFQSPDMILSVNYITKEFEEAGFSMIDTSFIIGFKHYRGTMAMDGQNIVAMIEGSDPVLKNEYIVLGAHYDHLGKIMKDNVEVVNNGADDNASGVATIIEAGKLILRKKDELKRSVILVAFDGEESGLIGSTSFVNDKVVDPLAIKAMFSIDMVGMYEKRGGVEIKGMNSIKQGEVILEETAGKKGVNIAKIQNSIEMRTDTWPFAMAGIPAIAVTTGTISPYHKPEDDSDLLDYSGMSEITELLSTMVAGLAKADDMEANKSFIARATNPKFSVGLTLSSGSAFHLYKDDFFNGKSVTALEAGLTSNLKISDRIGLQTGLIYEMTGGKTSAGLLRMHSAGSQMAITAGTSTESINAPAAYVLFGGYYRYNFAATLDGSSYDFKNDYYTNETGIMGGAGFRYANIQISFQRKYSLKRINRDIAEGNIFNRSNTFSLVTYF